MVVEVQQGNRVLRMSYEDFEEEVREGRLTARTLIRFEVVTGDDFVPAGDLELFQTLADPRRMQFRRNLTRPAMPILTAILVGLQIRIYLYSFSEDAESELQDNLANWAPSILEQGESWRLLSYGMLHLSFTHLLFNMCFLAYIGYQLERAIGRVNLALIFFASVFVGGLLSLFMSPKYPSLGASGGDFGLMAAAVIMGWKYGDIIPKRAQKFFGWALLPYLGFSIISGLMGTNVDNWSHLGGLLTGATLMTLLDPEVLPQSRSRNRWIRRTCCGVMLALCVSLFFSGNRLIPMTQEDDVHGWVYSTPSYWNQGWNERNEPTWFSPTDDIEVSFMAKVRSRPRSAGEATESLLLQIRADSQSVELRERSAVSRGDWQGEQVIMSLSYRGKHELVTGLILVRGLYEYTALIRVQKDSAENYEELIDRMLGAVELNDPLRLEHARADRSATPESWNTGLELAQALHRAGHPHEAAGIWDDVLTQQPHSVEALVGWLETLQAYELEARESAAKIALLRRPERPEVVVLAAEILVDLDRREDAQAVLWEAWRLSDRDERIEAAMRSWEMTLPDLGQD